MKIGKSLRLETCLTWWNKDCYFHTRKCVSLTASHFLYDWARDMILFSFDQKYESINEINKNETGYPAGYRISKKAGYPASRISGTTLVITGVNSVSIF